MKHGVTNSEYQPIEPVTQIMFFQADLVLANRGGQSMSSFSRATLGPFGHTMFSLKSIWLPDNYPVMINVMLAVNELNVANTKLNAPLHQNLTRSEKQALKDLRNNPNIILKISGQRL